MTYQIVVHPNCQDDFDKLCKKNHTLEEALRKKIIQIIENPYHYKPLSYDLAGERRVHIGSFVLKFEIDELNQAVRFLSLTHHDDAYKR